MTFLAPSLLAGLVVVSAPLIIHLLNKTRVRRMPWAAMRFLRASVERNRRRMQIEDLLLLVLRSLVVLLLVLGFARPAWNVIRAQIIARGEAVNLVLLIDDSMSMGCSNGVATRFAQAKQAAEKIIGDLPSGSQCSLFFVSDRVRKIVPQLTRDMALVRRHIASAEVGDGSSRLLPGVQEAVALLRKYEDLPGEIVIITDNQTLAWKQLPQIAALRDENKGRISLRVINVGARVESNLAVTGIRVGEGSVVAGQALRCVIDVTNGGESESKSARVALSIDGNPPSSDGVIEGLAPGQTRSLTLLTRFPPGYHTLTAMLPPDSLPSDNNRSVAVFAADQVKVLIVEGGRASRATDRDGFFLAHALMPVASNQDYYLKAQTVAVGEVTAEKIKDADVVILVNVARLSPALTQTLVAAVQEGKGVMLFPGNATDLSFYNSDPVFSKLLGARLDGVTEAAKPPGFQQGGYKHPVTALWNDARVGSLSSISINRYYPLKLGPETEKIQVIASSVEGQPLIVEKKSGQGMAILFNTLPRPNWTNLPLHPAFVPLMQRLIAHLCADREAPLILSPGGIYTQSVNSEYAGREFSVRRVGTKEERRVSGMVEAQGGTGLVRYNQTGQAGAYQIFIGNETKPVGGFAVQADAAESNLAMMSENEISKLNDTTNLSKGEASTPASAREFGMILLACALVLGVGETALAHRASRAH